MFPSSFQEKKKNEIKEIRPLAVCFNKIISLNIMKRCDKTTLSKVTFKT